MTTKHKIMLGFGCMIGIVAVMSVPGYRILDEAADGYDEYRRHAQIYVRLSNVPAGFNAADIAMNMFPDGYNESFIKKAQEAMDEVDKHLDVAGREIRVPRRLERVNAIRGKARVYREGLGRLLAGCRRMQEIFRTRALPGRIAAEEGMRLMARSARGSSHAGLPALCAHMERQIAGLRLAMENYFHSRSHESEKTITAKLADMRGALEKMRIATRQPYQAAEAHSKLTSAFAAWADGLAAMLEAGSAANAALAELRAIRAALDTEFAELSAAFDREMTIHGPTVREAMLGGQNLLLACGVAGLVLGVFAAFMIISGLARSVRETGAFARALADGDFHARFCGGEQGDLGDLPQSLGRIAAVLQFLPGDLRTLEKRIEAGDLEARGDVAAYCGGFAAMLASVNSLLNRFLHILESIPVPVVMLDKEKVTWLNAAGQGIFGADCKAAREDFGIPDDVPGRAVDTLKPASGEIRICPQGREMDILCTAVPLLDEAGEYASMLQVMTDVTAARQARRAMLKAAEQAGALAGRLVSSSGELAAQVERIARGVEMQCGHVESAAAAATAMTAVVAEAARSAGRTLEQSGMTENTAGEGVDPAHQVAQSISAAGRAAAALQARMQELGDKAERIGGVMKALSGIADQIRLPALRAEVEAARAGEAGRGFALVADDMRRLAEKTLSTAWEAGAGMGAIRQAVRAGIREAGEAARAVAGAAALADAFRAPLEIAEPDPSGAAAASFIAAAAEEQSAAAEEVYQSLEEINKIAKDAADGIRESSMVLHALSQTAGELQRALADLQ